MTQTPSAKPPPVRTHGEAFRLAGVVKLALVGLLVFATCGPSVDAQEDNAAAFFRADRERMQAQRQRASAVVQRPTLLMRRAAPVRGYARPTPPPATEQPPAEPPAITVVDPSTVPAIEADAPRQADAVDPAVVPPAPVKPAEPVFTIAVIGDSLGQLLGQGLTESFADRPEIAILRKARENTGLVRDDYFDWMKGARDIAAGTDRINLAIMMIGSNDRQALREGAVANELRSPRWQQLYGDRVEAVAQAFRDRKIPVLWVGLPIMKNDRFSADMAMINEIVKTRLPRAGAAFIDTWEAFLDDRGVYAAYGPDVNGQFQKLRSGDGVHFTRPGARKLAYFLEAEIRRAIEDSRPKIDAEIAAASARPALVQEPPGSAAVPIPPPRGSGGLVVTLPVPAAPAEVVIPVKPAEGAVVALTAPVVSPGGQLATRARPAVATDSQALLDRVVAQGRPLDARPGRADDFSWPRR